MGFPFPSCCSGVWLRPRDLPGRRRAIGRFMGGLLAASVLLVGPGGGADADERPAADYEAHEVKAALLLNFARFVEWPSSAFPATTATAPLRVGVLGRSLDYRQVGELFRNAKPIRGRAIELQLNVSDQEFRECHILFIPRSERRRGRQILEKLRGLPVLTVGEHEGFLDQNGMINFVVIDGSMRFEVNLDAAKRGGLKLHANLLKVAIAVRGQYD